MSFGLDRYSFFARFVPVFAVVVPPLVLLGTGLVKSAKIGIASGFIISVLLAIAAQLGRDRGKRLERGLWSGWGGSPTLQRLRYSGIFDPGRVERLHRRLEVVVAEKLPTQDEEAADPAAADSRYDEVSARVRALTRDHTRFYELFEENIHYGLRRNLWGLKPYAIAAAVITLVACGIVVGVTDGSLSDRIERIVWGAGASIAALAFWLIVVRSGWVRVPAEAYADRFVDAIDVLHQERTNGTR